MLKALRSNRGESYLDTALSFLAIIMVVVVALNIFSFLTLKMDMDYFAREMVDVATIHGTTNTGSGEVAERYQELVDETGISPTCSWDDTDYYSGTKVQYGHPIRLTLTYNTVIGGLGVFDRPITLYTHYSGLSQMYWK